jgi:CBS domain containing-hemolysin-like protein
MGALHVESISQQIAIWIVFCICLSLSFLLSGMEAGVFALSRLRIRQQMRAGNRSARVLHEYLEHPENFLWTILVGNTVANLLILAWLIAVLEEAFREHSAWLVAVYIFIVLLFYAFFDLLPKMLFRIYPNRLCVWLAPPFRFVHLALRPLVAMVESFSRLLLRWRGGRTFTGHLFGNREELRLVMQESAQGFTSEERAMINRVLDLQNLTVRQTMKPLAEVMTLSADTSAGEVLRLCREGKFTRIPVWEQSEGRRRIIGLVACNTLLYQPDLDPAKPVKAYARPALYVEEDLRLEVALRRMQRSGQRLAIVLGRERIESGIITLQDVLKVIFGEVSL